MFYHFEVLFRNLLSELCGTTKTSVTIAGLETEIRTEDISNTNVTASNLSL
jgi:hypothetical protein